MASLIDDVLQKDLMELLGLEHLKDEEKAGLYQKALETIQNRVLIRIASKLSEEDKQTFFGLIDKGDEKQIDDFLASKNINLKSIFGEEVLLYKMEMAKKSQMISEKK